MSRRRRKTKAILFAAICLFGISSWLDINGLWTEIPLMVGALPEGWNLPSHVIVVVQAANVAPLAYLLIGRLRPGLVKEWTASCAIMAVGLLSCSLMAFVWDKTSWVAGATRSTALLSLSFCLAIVDCTSSLVYLPYVARFESAIFVTALFVGEGLSGLIPALLGLAQMASSSSSSSSSTIEPRFSIGAFFAVLALLLASSLVSFLFVNFHPYFDAFRADKFKLNAPKGDTTIASASAAAAAASSGSTVDLTELKIEGASSDPEGLKIAPPLDRSTPQKTDTAPLEVGRTNRVRDLFAMYLLVAVSNALTNGLLPSVQSFGCLPYGQLAYDLSVKLSVLANPLACSLTVFVVARRLRTILIPSALGIAASAYQVYLAALSPNPILTDGAVGVTLAVLTSVVSSGCLSYAKVCIGTVLSEMGGKREKEKKELLLRCGLLTQAGSLAGALLGFLLVNVFRVFKM